MIGLDSYSRKVFIYLDPILIYISLWIDCLFEIRKIAVFPLAFIAGWLQGHWWGFISRNYVVWPTFLLMNVFIALKGSHFWFLFDFTAAGVVPCGGRKTSPRTSTIVQFIFYFGPLRSAIIFWEIRNKWLDSYSRQVFIYLDPILIYISLWIDCLFEIRKIAVFPLAFIAGWLQGHWWGFISRNYVVWPTFLLMNVFIALKGSHFWFLFDGDGVRFPPLIEYRFGSSWFNQQQPMASMARSHCMITFNLTIWAATWQNQQNERAPSEDSDLGIRPVWSESSLSAWRKLGSLATHWAHSEDSDQTGRMPRLIWVFAGRTLILLVLSCRGSCEWKKKVIERSR